MTEEKKEVITRAKKENAKTKKIQVRVSEREYEFIKRRAAARGMTMSEYLLGSMLKF